ncbi:unnamed protein product [Cylicocyclus nassatus]|uniref:Uncharacterized protein n=1 Tax=Cylicocyclus nassatus TaxID=53992 RepID=A0AA36GFX0_CYLNA|nr:unnamed protein product [Cylicocyclus nassatus]
MWFAHVYFFALGVCLCYCAFTPTPCCNLAINTMCTKTCIEKKGGPDIKTCFYKCRSVVMKRLNVISTYLP